MKWRLNFRQKIIVGYLLLFGLFVLIVYPIIEDTVSEIVYDNLKVNSILLIDQIKKNQSEKEMIHSLKEVRGYVFFRVSLFNAAGDVLYDSAVGEFFGESQLPFFPVHHPEVLEALKKGVFYSTGDSVIFKQKLVYVTIAFDFQGVPYILRTALPFHQVEQFTNQFKHWFLSFSLLTFLFLSGCLFLLFHRINYPIRQIIKAIKPYQAGQEEFISHIALSKSIDEKDRFYQLAQTLNSLSERIRAQIKHIVEERNEKEAILESLGEGVIAVDQDMRIRYANYIGSRMLGLSRKHLLGTSFADILSKSRGSLLEKCCHLLETCQKKMTILTDSIFIADGKKMYLDLIAAPKPQHNGAILVLQDKSSHYKVLEMGKDFVANASHELRTPITIIRGFAETLHDLPELPREMVSDITEKIVRNCQRMDNLVKNLLTLADLENLPESRFQECDLIALAENSKQVVLSIYEDAKITIEKSKDTITVDADPDILELAIINLMDNAAKYSHPPARITVKIDQVGDEAHIAITDKGIGIPPEDIEHVFERFYTVNKAHSRRLGGAGLGLSIVKIIIEKHHGTISVSSVLKQGTTFTIVLPIHRLSPFHK